MLKSIFTLEKMITPSIIKLIYWGGLSLSILYGIFIMVVAADEGMGAFGYLIGLSSMIVSPILIRVLCEMIQVRFKILKELETLNNNNK